MTAAHVDRRRQRQRWLDRWNLCMGYAIECSQGELHGSAAHWLRLCGEARRRMALV